MSEDQAHTDPLEQILPTAPLEHASAVTPSVDVFKPWHLPRKHHVRKAQWGAALDRLIDELPDRPMINYLCLPGEDLLDVQVLADVCRAKARRLQYVGFDHAEAAGNRSLQRVAAEQILRQTDVVEDTSEVVPDDFASIARRNSVGYQRLRNRGSYDVVNLDMCDSFTTYAHAHNHDAVLELLNHQSHLRGSPWLLFLTTHAEVNRLQQKELEVYDNRMCANIQESKDFRECLARLLSVAADTDVNALIAGVRDRRTRDSGFSGRWLALAIGKWLLGIMAQGSPWRVDLLSVYCYRTGLLSAEAQKYAAEPPNLFSLAFRLEKIRQPKCDPAGLACSPIPAGTLDEAQLAGKMAACIEKNTLDLDCHLQSNGAIGDGLMAECETLLSVRYYSRDAYTKWVRQIPRIVCPSAKALELAVRDG